MEHCSKGTHGNIGNSRILILPSDKTIINGLENIFSDIINFNEL
jgi:hypothetical protein